MTQKGNIFKGVKIQHFEDSRVKPLSKLLFGKGARTPPPNVDQTQEGAGKRAY